MRLSVVRATVVNMHHDVPYDVYVGRGRSSRWGNPFTHEPLVAKNNPEITLVSSREEAVAAYRLHLWNAILSGEVTTADLAELHGKRLACWCAPLPCHADVLASAAEWAAEGGSL